MTAPDWRIGGGIVIVHPLPQTRTGADWRIRFLSRMIGGEVPVRIFHSLRHASLARRTVNACFRQP